MRAFGQSRHVRCTSSFLVWPKAYIERVGFQWLMVDRLGLDGEQSLSKLIAKLAHQNLIGHGAGEGNRTLVCSLGSCRSTIELRPRAPRIANAIRGQQARFHQDLKCLESFRLCAW